MGVCPLPLCWCPVPVGCCVVRGWGGGGYRWWWLFFGVDDADVFGVACSVPVHVVFDGAFVLAHNGVHLAVSGVDAHVGIVAFAVSDLGDEVAGLRVGGGFTDGPGGLAG